jgi:glycosyltransferase involved in cell wall biosynthesis
MLEKNSEENAQPWVSFCMTTYKRPEFLKEQLLSLLTQTFRNFEIIISDNDPEISGEKIVKEVDDCRIKYFPNGANIGMISSFNKSIERSRGEFIVMVTDDDPVEPEFLTEMKCMVEQHNNYAVYGGFLFSGIAYGKKVIIPAERFIQQILDPSKTTWLLWSSCMIRREILMIRKIPDYGSPHLADHAMIALAGSHGGGLILNKKFSSLTSHQSNFSKFNFEYYVHGCKGFYEAFKDGTEWGQNEKVVRKHLYHWFIANIFNLKRYYTVSAPNLEMLRQVDKCAHQILEFDFMRGISFRYNLKKIIFAIKRNMGLLKNMHANT